MFSVLTLASHISLSLKIIQWHPSTVPICIKNSNYSITKKVPKVPKLSLQHSPVWDMTTNTINLPVGGLQVFRPCCPDHDVLHVTPSHVTVHLFKYHHNCHLGSNSLIIRFFRKPPHFKKFRFISIQDAYISYSIARFTLCCIHRCIIIIPARPEHRCLQRGVLRLRCQCVR